MVARTLFVFPPCYSLLWTSHERDLTWVTGQYTGWTMHMCCRNVYSCRTVHCLSACRPKLSKLLVPHLIDCTPWNVPNYSSTYQSRPQCSVWWPVWVMVQWWWGSEWPVWTSNQRRVWSKCIPQYINSTLYFNIWCVESSPTLLTDYINPLPG